MIDAEIGVRPVSCFVGPPPTLLVTLNLFDNPAPTAKLTVTNPALT